MATENKKYIPALRFPEFQNDGEWSMLELGKFAKIVMGQSPSSEAYNERGEGVPLLQGNADIKDRHQVVRVYTTDITKTCDINDIIMTVRAPVGTISRASFKSCIGRGVCAIKTDSEYLYQYLISIEQEWDKLASGSTFVSITSNQIFDRIIFVPLTIQEQKKIADCLSSLDKYIDATKRKLDLLKEYKKGLMQRLFPAKGKTIPELRFPEFQNDGEWIPRPLSDILNYEQPTPYIVKDDTYKKEGTPVLTANKGFILGYTDESFGIYNKLPVIIFDDFTTDKKYVDFSFKIKSSAMKLLTLKDEERDNLRFIFECMSNIVFEEKEHKRYYISEYQHINIYVPSSLQEQNQIADTLLPIDKQISEYDKKIKALELHKKGLMQQLFPKL